MRKIKKLCAFALACGMALGVVGCAGSQAMADTPKGEYEMTITSEMQGDTIALLDGEVLEFASNYTKGLGLQYAPAVAKQGTDRFAPKPATISWENNRDGALYYTVRVGLKKDLSDAESYLISNTSIDVDYLFAAKHYYYQIYAHYENDEVVKSRIFDFYTADLPRTVHIPNVSNTRDIGGRFVQDGKYQVRQGMIYRGAEVDPSSGKAWGAITEEGKHIMVDVLGIKTDLDLRDGKTLKKSPIDDSLNYINVAAPWYAGHENSITAEKYKAALTTEIRTFANPDNYPIYLHCSLGRDRAGTLAFLISALIGVEEIDLYRDYEMSFFAITGWADAAQSDSQHANLMNAVASIITHLNRYKGATLMDKTESFVKEYLGITQAEVDTIRSIMWEEVAK